MTVALILGMLIMFGLFWAVELKSSFLFIMQNSKEAWPAMLKSFFENIFIGLVWIWPASLFTILLAGEGANPKRPIHVLFVVSITVWIAYFILSLASI